MCVYVDVCVNVRVHNKSFGFRFGFGIALAGQITTES